MPEGKAGNDVTSRDRNRRQNPAEALNDPPRQVAGTGSHDAPDLPAGPVAEPIREHLGQQLRATYNMIADKPAYLGDEALPPNFDPYIRQLENRERIRHRGLRAVEDALRDIPGGEAPSDDEERS